MEIIEKINIDFTPDEVLRILRNYFNGIEKNKFSILEDLSFHNYKFNFKYYLIEHLNENGIQKDNTIELTNEDIENALKEFLNIYNYELVDYCFNILGSNYIEDIPSYNGIKVVVKPRTKKLYFNPSKSGRTI